MAHVNPIQVQKFLKGVDYPASKAALLEKAKSMGADENVCASLEQLPDEEFQTPADVSQAFGRLPDDVSGGGEAREAKGAGGKEEHRPAHKEEHKAGEKAGKEEPRAERKEEPKPAHKAEERGKEPARAGHKEPAHAGPKEKPNHSREFLVEALQDSMAEVQICEMAIEKSGNPDVKKFAQSMIDEHGKMGQELEKLAGDKKLDVPRNIRPEQKMTVDELSSLDGRDFEQRWIQYEIDVHERDVKVFRHYADMEDDPEIRKLAEHHVKSFGQHLKLAHEVGKRLARA